MELRTVDIPGASYCYSPIRLTINMVSSRKSCTSVMIQNTKSKLSGYMKELFPLMVLMIHFNRFNESSIDIAYIIARIISRNVLSIDDVAAIIHANNHTSHQPITRYQKPLNQIDDINNT